VTDFRLGGLLLIASAIASTAGATMPPLARTKVWILPLPDYLRVIREHELAWRAHAWGFAVGTVLMGIGLVVLAPSLENATALAAAALYVIVAPLWLCALAFRLDMTVGAARDADPGVFDVLGRWVGSLYTVFMVGGFYAIALVGVSLLDGGPVPAWTAWVLVAFGVAAGLSHGFGYPRLMGMRSPFDLPVLVQLVPLFVAIPLAFAAGS